MTQDNPRMTHRMIQDDPGWPHRNSTAFYYSFFRHSKLRLSIDHLAIVCLFLARPALDCRSLGYQSKLFQSGAGRAYNKQTMAKWSIDSLNLLRLILFTSLRAWLYQTQVLVYYFFIIPLFTTKNSLFVDIKRSLFSDWWLPKNELYFQYLACCRFSDNTLCSQHNLFVFYLLPTNIVDLFFHGIFQLEWGLWLSSSSGSPGENNSWKM